MRVLFVTAPFRSHLYVQAPLAWALRTAGHEVHVACSPDLAEEVARSGLTGVEIGEPVRLAEHMAGADPVAVPAPDPVRLKSRQSDYPEDDPVAELASNVAGWRGLFNPESAFEDLVAFAHWWRPNLVLTDTFTHTGTVAARATGAAHARMLFGADGLGQLRAACHEVWRDSADRYDPMREWLEPVLERYGCAFDETAVLGSWTVFPMPTWIYRPQGVHYLPMRHVPFNGSCRTPSWLFKPSARRRICLTLGLAHREGGFGLVPSERELLDAVADLDVEVVATLDESQLRDVPTIPNNVRVVDFVPLNVLLPSCSAIVHTGGAGTFASALEHAVPQLIVPNVYWAERWWGPLAMANGVEDRGAGVYLGDADQLTADRLHTELCRVLKEPSFADAARRLRTEMIGMPSPNDMVPILEKLTAEHCGDVR